MTDASQFAFQSQSALFVNDRRPSRLEANDKRTWQPFLTCGAAILIGTALVIGSVFVIFRQGTGRSAARQRTRAYEVVMHLGRKDYQPFLNGDDDDVKPPLSRTPFLCTVGLSLDLMKHADLLLHEDGLCDYIIFQSTFVADSDGKIDLWDGHNRTRAFRTFLAFARVTRKTAYGVAVTHRKSREALRQLGTVAGIGEFANYWIKGVRHYAVLDVDERSISGPRDLRSTFALLKAFRLLQHAQMGNDTSSGAYIFFGCTTALPKTSLLHDILRVELSSLPVDVIILTTHAMVSEESEKVVAPPTALRAPEGSYPPPILDVAQQAAEAEYLQRPTAVALTLPVSVLAYEVPERTREGAVCDRGPIEVPMKEVCSKSNYPLDVKYGNSTVIGRFYSPTMGRLYLFDTKDTFHFKMCTLREAVPEFVHGWAVFGVDLADYDGTCNGASRTLERVRAIRETFEEYLKLDAGRPPNEAC